MCVCSNSRNDVTRVAQRYGTIAAHTRRRASVLIVYVVFCVHVYSFAGLIRRTPPPTFSDTAITDRHSDTTNFQLRAHWVRISWSIGSEKVIRTCAPGGSRTLDSLRARRAPYPLGQALRFNLSICAGSIKKFGARSLPVPPNNALRCVPCHRHILFSLNSEHQQIVALMCHQGCDICQSYLYGFSQKYLFSDYFFILTIIILNIGLL